MRRPLVLLLSAAALLLLSFLIPPPDADRLLEREAVRLQERVNERAHQLGMGLSRPNDPDAAVWIWRTGTDSLLHWTANWPVNEDSLRADRKGHMVLPDGIALHGVFSNGSDEDAHQLVRVWQTYPFQNTYLRPSFAVWTRAAPGLIAETGPGIGPVVRDADGAVMFRLAWAGEVRPFTPWDAVRMCLLLLAGALLVASCWSLAVLLGAHERSWTAVLAFTTAIVGLRWAGLAAYPIPPFDRLALFGPELYAASSWLPSLGDLLINAILLVVIARFAHVTLRGTRLPSGMLALMSGTILTGLLLWLAWWITDAFIGLVRDSSVDLDLFHLQDLNRYSALALLCIALLFLGWGLMVDVVARSLVPRHRIAAMIGMLCIATGISIVLHDLIGVVDLILVLWPLPLISTILHARRTRLDFFHALFTVMVLAFLSAHVLVKYDRGREERDRIVLAERLLTEDDPVVELLFRQTAPRLRHDAAVYALLSDTAPCDPAELDVRIRQPYFTGYWDRYDVRLHAFRPDGTLRCATSPDPPRSLAIGEGFTPVACRRRHAGPLHRCRAGRAPVLPRASGGDGERYLTSRAADRRAASTHRSEGQGFPELLLNDPDGVSRRMGRYAFARYDHGTLMEYRGFAFPLHWVRASSNDRIDRVTIDNMDLLAYGDPQGSLVVLGTPALAPLDRATTFSWLFGFFSIALAAVFGLREVLRARGLPPLGIGGKVRLALLTLAAMGLVVFGLGAQRTLARMYTARSDAALLEKSRSVVTELGHKLDGVQQLAAPRANTWRTCWSRSATCSSPTSTSIHRMAA
jgi:hypothetical protein